MIVINYRVYKLNCWCRIACARTSNCLLFYDWSLMESSVTSMMGHSESNATHLISCSIHLTNIQFFRDYRLVKK